MRKKNKTPDYQLKASADYKKKLKAEGYVPAYFHVKEEWKPLIRKLIDKLKLKEKNL